MRPQPSTTRAITTFNKLLNFSSSLRDELEGLGLSQTAFAAKMGMTKSKLSRILSGRIAVDKQTLDQFLAAIPPANRRRIVIAYLQDAISQQAIAALKVQASVDPWAAVQFRHLSPKGEKALRFLLESPELQRVERIFIDLAGAFGWQP